METVYILMGITSCELFINVNAPKVVRVYSSREAAEVDIPKYEADGWKNLIVNAWQVH